MKINTSSLKIWALFGVGLILALVVIVGSYNRFQRSETTGTIGLGIPQMALSSYAEPGVMMDEAMMIAPSPVPRSGGAALKGLDGEVPEARVIRNGNLSLRVDDVASSLAQARDLMKKNSGVVQSTSVSDAGVGPRTAYMTLRVPIDKFDETIAELKSLAVVVLHESTSAQDVTMEFIDLEADLRNAKAEEESYLKILDRSGSVEEILAVTRQLAQVRQRIERLEGRKRYMESQTDLATLSLTMTEETRIEAPGRTWRPGEVLRDAVQDLVISFQELVDFGIRAIIVIVGLLLPIGLVIWLFVWLALKVIKKMMK